MLKILKDFASTIPGSIESRKFLATVLAYRACLDIELASGRIDNTVEQAMTESNVRFDGREFLKSQAVPSLARPLNALKVALDLLNRSETPPKNLQLAIAGLALRDFCSAWDYLGYGTIKRLSNLGIDTIGGVVNRFDELGQDRFMQQRQHNSSKTRIQKLEFFLLALGFEENLKGAG